MASWSNMNAGGGKNWWKYSQEGQPSEITGAVVEIRRVQDTKYYKDKPGQPLWWVAGSPEESPTPIGDPVATFEIDLLQSDGEEISIGKVSPSKMENSIWQQLGSICDFDLENLLGQVITISTTNDMNHWSKNSRGGWSRPWQVDVVQKESGAEVRGMVDKLPVVVVQPKQGAMSNAPKAAWGGAAKQQQPAPPVDEVPYEDSDIPF